MSLPLLSALFPGGLSSDPEVPWPAHAVAAHGALSRLPALLRRPELASFDALAQVYRGPLSFGRGLRDPQTFDSHANAASLFKLGLTVYLRDLSPVVPGAAAFLRALELELGVAEGCARLTAFASPSDDGVSCHFDAEEVISVQIAGRKTFHVAPMDEVDAPHGAQFGPGMAAVEDLYGQVTTAWPDATRARFDPIDMQPGSVLFVPRGTWHRTDAHEHSFSLSIVIRPPSAADALVQALQARLLADAAWRRPLRALRGPSADGPAGDRERARLQALLDTLPQQLAGWRADDVVPLGLEERLARIVPATRFLRVPMSELTLGTVAPRRDELRVQAWDRQWVARETLRTDIPADIAPIARHIADSAGPFSLHALSLHFPDVPPPALVHLLQLLVRAHAVRLLGASPASAPFRTP